MLNSWFFGNEGLGGLLIAVLLQDVIPRRTSTLEQLSPLVLISLCPSPARGPSDSAGPPCQVLRVWKRVLWSMWLHLAGRPSPRLPLSQPSPQERGLLSPDLRPWLRFLATALVSSPRPATSTDGPPGRTPAGLTQLSSRRHRQSSPRTLSQHLLSAELRGHRKDRTESVPSMRGTRQSLK